MFIRIRKHLHTPHWLTMANIRDVSNMSICSALWSWGVGLVPVLSWRQIFWRRIALRYSNIHKLYNPQLLIKMTWSDQVRELGRHRLSGKATKCSRVGQKWRDRMPCPDILNKKSAYVQESLSRSQSSRQGCWVDEFYATPTPVPTPG